MRPIPILLSVNFALFAIWGLMFVMVTNRPEYIPLFMAFQTALNFLGAGIFFLDRRKSIAIAFIVGGLVCAAASTAGFVVLNKYHDQIRVEEAFTT